MRHGGVENIFVDVVAGTRVDEQHVVFEMAVRQASKPLQALLSNHLNCPTNHRGRVVVEPLENFRVGARTIVIADQGQPMMFRDFVQAPLGIAPVADDIAKTQRLVHGRTVT